MRYLEDFIGAVKAQQKSIADSLVAGNAVTFEAYQRLVGQYQGLQESLTILDNLLKEDIDDDN